MPGSSSTISKAAVLGVRSRTGFGRAGKMDRGQSFKEAIPAMNGQRGFFEGHWLSRIDEYPQFPSFVFGLGASRRVGEVAQELAKNRRSIIVTDAKLVELGVIDAPKSDLEKRGFSVDVQAADSGEPQLDEIESAAEIVRAEEYGLVVGIGGGAAMDRAKMTAAMAETPGDLEEYLWPVSKPLVGVLPCILLPTTSGTGSECSNYAVVTVPDEEIGSTKKGVSDSIFCDAALIDPTLTLSLPPRMTAGSGMDAMSHAAEAVMSIQANPFSDATALAAIRLVSENLGTAYHHGDSIEARWNMALAAAMGGVVISYPWVAGPATLGHVVSEGISSRYGVPHGEACGILLPFVYWYNLPDTLGREKIAGIAAAMGEDISGLRAHDAARKAISATFDLLESINMPTNLQAVGIPPDDIPLLAEYVLQRAEKMYNMSKYNPVKATIENLRDFFQAAFEGRCAVE